MIRFGFEMELFVVDGSGAPVLVPTGVPYDECGWLAEVRSEPHNDVEKAIALFKVEIGRVRKQVRDAGFFTEQSPYKEIPRELKVKASRQFGKGIINYRNIYGFETHRNSTKLQTAAVHVSVTNQREFVHKDGVMRYSGFIDHARFIMVMDKAFKEEIRKAKRNPGFYEVKSDGRIEYRSLPNDINLDKLTEVLRKISF